MQLLSRRSMLAALGLGGLVAAGSLWPSSATARRLPSRASWVVFYGDRADPHAFDGYSVIVLDPRFTGDIEALKAGGATTLGYLSLGEISNRGPFFGELNDPTALLHENPNWPGTFTVDARRPAWERLILQDIIPAILQRGFNGLFLDTIDSLIQLENTDYRTYGGMRDAGSNLVRAIRRAYPDIPIMMNRGYSILPDVIDDIDAVLAESLVTTYDFQTRAYEWQSQDAVTRQIAMLEPARKAAQPVPIYSLDYWNPTDPAALNRIYQLERAMGHAPYVATILLNQFVREPA